MKIAVCYDNGNVFQHFGHTEQFKLYDIEDGKLISSEVVDTNGQGHGILALFLKQHGVRALICGGIGGGAKQALANAGIDLYCGVSGLADVAAVSFANGTLVYNPNVECTHHSHEHGHECSSHDGHTCGGHCGSAQK